MHMRRTADRLFGKDYHWSVLGAGRNQMPIAVQAIALGGNVRVGIETRFGSGQANSPGQARSLPCPGSSGAMRSAATAASRSGRKGSPAPQRVRQAAQTLPAGPRSWPGFDKATASRRSASPSRRASRFWATAAADFRARRAPGPRPRRLGLGDGIERGERRAGENRAPLPRKGRKSTRLAGPRRGRGPAGRERGRGNRRRKPTRRRRFWRSDAHEAPHLSGGIHVR